MGEHVGVGLGPQEGRPAVVVGMGVGDHHGVDVGQGDPGHGQSLGERLPGVGPGEPRIDQGHPPLVFEDVAVHVTKPGHRDREAAGEECPGATSVISSLAGNCSCFGWARARRSRSSLHVRPGIPALERVLSRGGRPSSIPSTRCSCSTWPLFALRLAVGCWLLWRLRAAPGAPVRPAVRGHHPGPGRSRLAPRRAGARCGPSSGRATRSWWSTTTRPTAPPTVASGVGGPGRARPAAARRLDREVRRLLDRGDGHHRSGAVLPRRRHQACCRAPSTGWCRRWPAAAAWCRPSRGTTYRPSASG